MLIKGAPDKLVIVSVGAKKVASLVKHLRKWTLYVLEKGDSRDYAFLLYEPCMAVSHKWTEIKY